MSAFLLKNCILLGEIPYFMIPLEIHYVYTTSGETLQNLSLWHEYDKIY